MSGKENSVHYNFEEAESFARTRPHRNLSLDAFNAEQDRLRQERDNALKNHSNTTYSNNRR